MARKRYDVPAEGMRFCQGACRRELPASEDFFDRDASKPGGFKLACKKCRKERRELEKLRQASDVLAVLDRSVLANISETRPGGSVTPHQLEFYQILTGLFGGAQGAAMNWMANYIAAPAGSQTRERMLGQYTRLMEACSSDSKVSPPAEMMSDDELNAAIKRDEERMRRNEERLKAGPEFGGEVHDAG